MDAAKKPGTAFSRQVKTSAGQKLLDGRPLAWSNWMRYVNTATSEQQHNLVAFEHSGALYYKTCRAVGAFEELLLLDEAANPGKARASGAQKSDTLWPREVYSCAKCGDCFSSELSLTKHHRHSHPEKQRGVHCCSQCDYSTSIRSRLNQHMLTHTAERPFVCEMCKKDFTWRSDLNVHLLTHTQERPYECPDCGQRFNCLSHMNRHRKSHSRDPRPHVCPHCGKCYARRDYLKVHMTTHETERRHQCPACARRFTDPSNAKHHYNFVHLKKYPLSCPHCDKGFASRRDVRRHVLAEHENCEK